MHLIDAARTLAEQLMSPLDHRWAHVCAVARRADELRIVVDHSDVAAEILVAAAWVHDIGYAPAVKTSGFHALDGARYLLAGGYPQRVVCLVAHHSGARFEAVERGLEGQLSVFPLEESPVMDALITADLTTGPDGTPCTYEQRIDEVLARYPSNHPVHRTWTRAREPIGASIRRTEERLKRLA